MNEFVREALVGVDTWGKVKLARIGSGGAINDSYETWKELMAHRNSLVAIIHSHPGAGEPSPSPTDLMTFQALSQSGFSHLTWWIVTTTHVAAFLATGEKLLSFNYEKLLELGTDAGIPGMSWLDDLRDLSSKSMTHVGLLLQRVRAQRR